jgi:predicted tellurium resistance membrane protein TerC
MKNKSPKIITIEKNIESFLYWSVSILFGLLGLIFFFTYFQPKVEQHEILVAIRYQLLCFTTAVLCCPLVSIPTWFPFPSQYRFLVFVTALIIAELMSLDL